MKHYENTFSCEDYRTLTFFFRAAYVSRRPRTTLADDKDRRARSPFFRIKYKQNTKVWNLKLHYYREEHKSYLQGISARYDLI